MASRLVDLVEQLLQSETDFIVPMKRIWLKLSLMGKVDNIGFESFSFMLKGDDRFEIFENDEEDLENEQIESLEENGFFAGPKIMLKSRKPSRKELGDILIKKATVILDNLKDAWEVRDKNNEDQEDQLLYALASTQRLLKALKNEFPESNLDY